MSAASNMKGESIAILLRHEEMPIIVALICEMFNKRKEVYVKKGFVFNSNQRLKPSRITREALKLVFEPPGDGRNKFLQDVAAHPKVRRGDYPIADLNLDTSRKYCEMELSEMNALLGTSAPNAVSVGGSKVIGPEAAANGTASSSRKRSYSRVTKDETANKSLEGPKGAKVATDRSLRAHPASVDGGRSSDRKAPVANGGSVTKQPLIVVIDDEDVYSVPELGEEEDVCSGLVAGVVEVKSEVAEDAALDLLCLEALESLLDSPLELDLDLAGSDGSSGSIRKIQSSGQKSSDPYVSLTDCGESELFEYLSSHLGTENEYKDKGKLQRPSKRARTDSLDSLFALLD